MFGTDLPSEGRAATLWLSLEFLTAYFAHCLFTGMGPVPSMYPSGTYEVMMVIVEVPQSAPSDGPCRMPDEWSPRAKPPVQLGVLWY